MGKTYKKQSHQFDDDAVSGRSAKRASNKSGMKTLNSFVEQDYDFENYDPFDDEIEIKDNVTIQHTKHTP